MEPNSLLTRWLVWTLPSELKEPISGDLLEEYNHRAQQHQSAAAKWYLSQVVRTSWRYLKQTKQGIIMFIFGILTFIAVTLMAMIMGGGLEMFIDIPSIILVLVPSLLFSITVCSWHDIKKGISLVINDEQEVTQQQLKKSQKAYRVLGNTAMLTGWFATIIGAVAIANHANEEDFFMNLGPAMAVCVLTLLYGVGIKTVAYVVEQRLLYIADNQE